MNGYTLKKRIVETRNNKGNPSSTEICTPKNTTTNPAISVTNRSASKKKKHHHDIFLEAEPPGRHRGVGRFFESSSRTAGPTEWDQVSTTRVRGNSGGGGGGNKIGTLARVNSEVSYVGPTNSRPLDGNEKKKTPVNSNKKLKQCGSGGKRDGGGGKGVVVEFSKDLVKRCGELLGNLMKHQYGWVFNEPVDAKKLKLHDYYKIIKHPMDLGTVKNRLSKNWYKSPKEFAEDVRLTFNNAMKYNEKGQDVHAMADTLLKIFEENWAKVKGQTNVDKRGQMGHDVTVPTPALKRAPGPRASSPACGSASKRAPGPRTSPPACGPAFASGRAPSPAAFQDTVPLETRTLDRTDSLTELVHSKMKAAKTAADQGRTSVSKKPKKNDTDKGEMTYEEKQKLSGNLQSLPSEKLESVVQIIRKRNPGLFQQEDEIEVDIDSFDNETLWELHRYVTDYQKSMSKNDREAEVALQGREEAGHYMHRTNLTSATAEAPKELGSAQMTISASSPIKEHRQGRSMSRSSSSSSSGSGSRSSSSGSDSDSSSGSGSDAGQ
ncbi:unnamed protein product [Dovyalis caffra]|uniref:Transcription factor GTE4-like n=1 Tax=Dovyalis caffra TaxID=77055 RepID=A0AAV1SGA8_9ROSI|nr:unnamed protein product [Dovyalis caffra]